MKKIIITTSWDDGAKEDLRILELLNKYNLKGTFYIPKSIHFEFKRGKYLERIPDFDILKIARTQEVGAHTLNHTYLNKLKGEELYQEIKGSKDWLEKLLNKPVKIFAYPGGVFNEEIVEMVRKSGFVGARTSISFNTKIKDPFLMGFSSPCYPCFPNNKEWSLPFRLRLTLKRAKSNIKGVKKLGLSINSIFRWELLVRSVFDYVLKNGGIFHLYGHPWEIERYNLWEGVERIFSYISNREDILYLTNSETIEKYNL